MTSATVQGDFECLDVSFNQTGAINLNKNYPVTDDYALANFTPIEATITNNCSTNAVNYVLSLSSIYLKSANYDTGYIPDTKIRVKTLKQVGTNAESSLKGPIYLNTLSQLDNNSNSYKYINNFYKTDSNYTNYNLKNTYKVDSSSIAANTTIKYKIYLWIDYYEGAPDRVSSDEYNNSTQGLKFSASAAVTLNIKEAEEPTWADELIASGNLWQSGLEGDGYRYTGSGAVGTSTNPNNFICFGTTDKSECTANQDKYMYRVLGVFSDTNGDNHVKLIKYKQLGKYAWNADYQTDISWENSDMYKGLNGSYFLTNITYDYLQNATWSNKIENWTWSAVNTKTVSNSGPNYYNSLTPSQIYLHEMNRSTKTSTVGEWTTQSAKIGLMYASDYQMSLGSSALTLIGLSDKATLKTGWIHQSNNDTSKSTIEWTLSRFGYNFGSFDGWNVYSDGFTGFNALANSFGVRPVFYLSTYTKVSSGDGSLGNPFIIQE